ncbi:MAG TPA: LuxR C-terminal-related transcriptional regulator [Anaerolineales bacterium]
MSILRKLLARIGLRPISAPRKYEVSESMQMTLTTLAQHEGRPEDELIQNLLAAGLTHYYETEELWKQWESLSPREKEVTALACLGCTNKEIAKKLIISPETVKSHLRNALIKFNMNSKAELRSALQGWDFAAWA